VNNNLFEISSIIKAACKFFFFSKHKGMIKPN